MIRLADYVVNFLVKKGITDIFLVSGGGIMYLLDAVGRNKNIKYIANHHEQASATAAEAWARVKNHIAACLVTTGPGSTNAITGVAAAWYDSIPMIVISGQVKRELISDYSRFRQTAQQEIDIIPMVRGITKYATTVMEPNKIKYELEKSHYFATVGRPGPVWINIPLDVQGTFVNENHLLTFKQPKEEKKDRLKEDIRKLIQLIIKSKRPILVGGHGIRLAGADKLFLNLLKKVKIPVVLPINGLDLVPENNAYLVGKFGPFGQRRGNFALQNADLVIALGASLNVASIGFNYKGFAPSAKKVMINIDPSEMIRPTIKVNLPIHADAKEFILEFLAQSQNVKFPTLNKWHDVCQEWKKNYPTIIPDFFKNKKYVNSYIFFDKLSDKLSKNNVLVTGIALDACSLYQAFRVKRGGRAFVNQNFGQMGWDLPAAIGACVANGKKITVCVTGDGSIQMNSQELETIKSYKLPIKLFIFNNSGYESIRATQNNFFGGHLVGADKKTGVSNPDFKFLAAAYSMDYAVIKNNDQIDEKLNLLFAHRKAVLCEINIDPGQKRMPKASSYRRPDGVLESRPLEDMYPFLSREEIYRNMHMFDAKSKVKSQKLKVINSSPVSQALRGGQRQNDKKT